MTYQIKILQNTVLKQEPIQSFILRTDEKADVQQGTVFEISAYLVVNDHLKFTLAHSEIQGRNTWFVYCPHIELLRDGCLVSLLPAGVHLPVPYFSQLDNAENPFGSCNVTSMAMALAFFGVKGKNSNERLEDELQDWLAARGLDRHSPQDLAVMVRAYGCHDDFRSSATIAQIKQHLTGGNPVVVHGYFTSSGHVVCLIGYNDKGFVVNDPYGEWFADGYDRNDATNPDKGKGLTYSYAMIERTCDDEGIWAHFLSR